MPIRRSHAKVAVGLFWAESWLFWSHFLRYRLQYRLNSCNLQILAEMGSKVSQEFGPRTAAKIIMEKY